MPATERELLTARIFLRAAFPVMKVVLEDVPAMQRRFQDVQASVLFVARNGAEHIGATLVFDESGFRVEQSLCDSPDITFAFPSVKKMNAMLAGKLVLPRIRGWTNLGLLIKIFQLLLSLKLMMPTARPTDPEKRRLKVKMTLYMITTALSQYNKGGDPEMTKWTAKQPERIYQMSVEPEGIAAYLRVRGGLTKAGRGYYARRRPFVHMKFHGVDGALPVLLKDTEFVESVAKGYVSVEGSPEYAAAMNDFMQRIQAMVT